MIAGNSRGQSLIQVLVSVAIMGVLLTAMTAMQTNQSRENQALAEKLGALEFQRLMTATLSTTDVCTYLITNAASKTFDSSLVTATTSPPPIDLGTRLLATGDAASPAIATVGQSVSPLTQNLVVQSIQLGNIKCPPPCPNPSTSNQFTANMLVNFDNSRLVRAIQPAISQVTLQTTGGATKTIVACQAVAGGGGTGTLGEGVLCGFATHDMAAGFIVQGPTCQGHAMGQDLSGFGGPQPCPPGYTRRDVQLGSQSIFFYSCVKN